MGAQRVGIGMDDVATQAQFAGQHGFDYPLLPDATGDVAAVYGLRRRFLTPVSGRPSSSAPTA